jgi:hypothetical protein
MKLELSTPPSAPPRAGLRIYTVGVGSPKGEIIRLRDDQGATTYLKDSQGNVP